MPAPQPSTHDESQQTLVPPVSLRTHTVGEFAPPCDGYNPHPLRHFSVDQAVSAFAFVRPQQHLGVTATIGGLPSSLHQPFQLLTLYHAQSHHITFLQG